MNANLILTTLPWVMLLAFTVTPPVSAQSEKTYVTIDDIGSSVLVLGRLGVPLRTMVKFKAKWIESTDRSKPESIPLRLKIIEVDGKLLERDVLFLPADVQIVNSTGQEKTERELHREVSLYGYEDWVTHIPPIEFRKAIGELPMSGLPRGKTQLTAILLSVQVGDTFNDTAEIDGIGEIALPSGKWTLEYVDTPEPKTFNPDVYVFKKEGDRLERLTFQRFGPHFSPSIGNCFDSIGDNTSNGIPVRLLDWKSEHDTVHIFRPVAVREQAGAKATCMVSSFIYTNETIETKDPWMSNAFVCDRDDWVLVCVHASPHVLSPETVDKVFTESKFDRGTNEPKDEDQIID